MSRPRCFQVLCSILLAVLPLHAAAEFYSGSKLKGFLEQWERRDIGVEGGLGAGYVVGVFDRGDGASWCSPERVTVGQITSMVLKQLRDNPDKLHFSGDVHAAHIFKKTWPCPNRQPSADGAVPAPPSSSAPRSTPRPKPKEQDPSPF